MADMSRNTFERAIAADWSIGNEPASALEGYLATTRFADDTCASRAAVLDALRARRLDRLPLPARGATAARWRALAAVAACDLALAKLYESHTDALAILAELNRPELADAGTWAVWAAEPPDAKLAAHAGDGRVLRLDGIKPWCSGAGHVGHALVTAWRDGEPVLAAVDLAQPCVSVDASGWQAVGMRATGTGSVRFDGARATQIGEVGAYLARPGFWHGGAGIAACWHGCAAAIATTLLDSVARRAGPHAHAHLGAVDAELSSLTALLRDTAAWIDAHPHADAQLVTLRVRLATERTAARIIERASRALGPAPFCMDAWFARALADLPVFMRQSHAERDEEALGHMLVERERHGMR